MTFCFRIATIAGHGLSCFGLGSSTKTFGDYEMFDVDEERTKSQPLYPGVGVSTGAPIEPALVFAATDVPNSNGRQTIA
jgi:hypothetical protein